MLSQAYCRHTAMTECAENAIGPELRQRRRGRDQTPNSDLARRIIVQWVTVCGDPIGAFGQTLDRGSSDQT